MAKLQGHGCMPLRDDNAMNVPGSATVATGRVACSHAVVRGRSDLGILISR